MTIASITTPIPIPPFVTGLKLASMLISKDLQRRIVRALGVGGPTDAGVAEDTDKVGNDSAEDAWDILAVIFGIKQEESRARNKNPRKSCNLSMN